MDEALFARLALALRAETVVLADVMQTQGATPRKRGSRMLIGADWTAFSIGGGLAEARVIAAAHALLATHERVETALEIDLGGGAGAAGICGGRMQLLLRRWSGAADLALAQDLAAQLAGGHAVVLPACALQPAQTLQPDARLLIIGAGHCGLALYELARQLDFNIAVYDNRAEGYAADAFAEAETRSGDAAQLQALLDTGREVYAVLLNRDFNADIAALDLLCRHPPRFIGMMGSPRRIRQVTQALPQHAAVLAQLHAPVGLAIGAQTPQEIAVSILAQLIQQRCSR
jgi:xanthine dehydrogenase accessory factor